MAKLPTNVISLLYGNSRAAPRKIIGGGRGYAMVYDNGLVILYHYGTEIIRVDENNRKYTIGEGAYSNSDRDAINSLLMIEGIDGRASNRQEKMYSHNDDEEWKDESILTYNMKETKPRKDIWENMKHGIMGKVCSKNVLPGNGWRR